VNIPFTLSSEECTDLGDIGYEGVDWIHLVIGSNCVLLWVRWWTFELLKNWEYLD